MDTVHVTCPIQHNNIDYIKEEWPITEGYWSHSYIMIVCSCDTYVSFSGIHTVKSEVYMGH